MSVSFLGETRAGTADDLGFWSVYLPPAEPGGPFELSVKGSNTITLRDVMVGDVWVDSGQSNMEWPLRNALNGEAEVAAANHPNIRFFKVSRKSSPFPAMDAARAADQHLEGICRQGQGRGPDAAGTPLGAEPGKRRHAGGALW